MAVSFAINGACNLQDDQSHLHKIGQLIKLNFYKPKNKMIIVKKSGMEDKISF
jgi:hypothetical protein